MYPKDNKLVCIKCGYTIGKKGKKVVQAERKKKEVPVIEKSDDLNVLPKTEKRCPKCSHNEAFWILRQMRGSDEPESRFYTCTKCKHRWRED
jgi:DNA-directed RNA polymerase subunit M